MTLLISFENLQLVKPKGRLYQIKEPFEKQWISLPVLSNSIRKRFHTPNDSSLILPVTRIKDSYLKFGFKPEKEDIEEQGLFYRKTAKGHLTIVIPDEDKLLHELLLTIAHCSFAGHPNKRLTAVMLSRQFTWSL